MNEELEQLKLEVEVLKEFLSDGSLDRILEKAFSEVFGDCNG